MPRGQVPKKDAETGETWTGSCMRAMSPDSEWGNPRPVMGSEHRRLNYRR